MVNSTEAIKEIQQKFSIIGREEELRKIILAHSIEKNILIEGEVGVGKTTLARGVASYFDAEFYRVDCSEETLTHNLVGFWDPPIVISKGYTEDAYAYGPLTSAMMRGGCLFINEINRMPEITQNILLTALDEKQINIPKLKQINAKKSFFTIATLNPSAHIGVSVLGEAIKDRFIWINLEYQSSEEEKAIIIQESDLDGENVEIIANIAEQIILRTRKSTSLRRGSSIRGGIDLAAIINEDGNIKSSKSWVESSIMALYNKIELEDGISKSKKDVITEIVLSVLNKSDFQ
ncbi:MAG: AAA domain-containing protein [Candidatus Lokiarchaeota archaeon]|nr:AAA domain-containing protein [Candidatus Lokiarchaeota archaeon]MBD3200209.1 AAA domain-containing protein [Candidatus Lokiarchaeota archaeon]